MCKECKNLVCISCLETEFKKPQFSRRKAAEKKQQNLSASSKMHQKTDVHRKMANFQQKSVVMILKCLYLQVR